MSLHFARLPSTRAFGVMTVRWCDHNLVGYLFIVHIRDIQLEISSIYVIYLLKSLTFVNDYIIDYIIVYIIYIYTQPRISNDVMIIYLCWLLHNMDAVQYPDPAWRESRVDGKVGHHHAKRFVRSWQLKSSINTTSFSLSVVFEFISNIFNWCVVNKVENKMYILMQTVSAYGFRCQRSKSSRALKHCSSSNAVMLAIGWNRAT